MTINTVLPLYWKDNNSITVINAVYFMLSAAKVNILIRTAKLYQLCITHPKCDQWNWDKAKQMIL